MALTTVTGSMITPSTTLSGDITVTGTMVMSSSFMRNRIINGAMVIDQRNAGSAVTPTNGQYTLDRWGFYVTQASKLTTQQNASSVTPPAGFTNYLGVTSSSAYSITSTDFFLLQQVIEAYNIADLGFGTANAKTITISFWARSSLTGTFGAVLSNGNASSRNYAFTYSIPVANTWTYITQTIPGDTSGTYNTTNTGGLTLIFGLGVGSAQSGATGSWSSSVFYGATGATSVVGTNGATFYLTGVQLEIGTSATPFERRLYNQELANCQRYYEELTYGNPAGGYIITAGSWSTTQGEGVLRFGVIKRATPTMATSGTISITKMSAAPVTGLTALFDNPSIYSCLLYNNSASGLVVGQVVRITADSTSTKINASAEL
jgi:hypothetical protein